MGATSAAVGGWCFVWVDWWCCCVLDVRLVWVSSVLVLGPGCSDSVGCRCGDFPPRLILPRRAPGSLVVVWIVVVVVVHAGGCGGRRWLRSIVCLVCVFLVLVQQRLGMVADLDLFLQVVEVHKTRKGMVRLTRKGLVRLTRKGLVSDVLNSSLDLSFYA